MTTWRDIRDDLERYCGEPQPALLRTLKALERINEAMYHDRPPEQSDYQELQESVDILKDGFSPRRRRS